MVVSIEAESEFLHSHERLVSTANRIRVMINPLGPDHQKLLDIMDGLSVCRRTAPSGHDLQGEGAEVVRQLATMSVATIRHEWLQVQPGT